MTVSQTGSSIFSKLLCRVHCLGISLVSVQIAQSFGYLVTKIFELDTYFNCTECLFTVTLTPSGVGQ